MEEVNTGSVQESGLTFKEFGLLLWRNAVLIAVITVLIFGAGLAVAFTRKPTYTASRNIIVVCDVEQESGTSGSPYSNAQVVRYVISTVSDIIKSGAVKEKADEQLTSSVANNKTGVNIKNIKTSYDSTGYSSTVKLSYTDASRELAIAKVNAIYDCAATEVQKRDESGMVYFSVNVKLSSADVNAAVVVNSNRTMIAVVSLVLGLIAAVVVVMIKYFLDDTVTSKEVLERMTGVKVFAYLEGVDADEMGGVQK